MRISTMMHNVAFESEDRKRALQRREMGEAYKRSAKFVEASKNPVLAALENLISGKAEKDLMKADQANAKSFAEKSEEKLEQPEIKKQIDELKRTEQEVITHEQAHKAAGPDVTGAVSYPYSTGPDDQRYIVGGEVPIQMKEGSTHEETIRILETVQRAALAPAEPSPQDLRVAASAAAQIQQTRSEMLKEYGIKEVEPFVNEKLEVEIPERFQHNVERDAQQPTVFGQNLEKRLYELSFNRATNKYASHIAMVKNGYMPYTEPTFSQIA